jgi:hypothetical protein
MMVPLTILLMLLLLLLLLLLQVLRTLLCSAGGLVPVLAAQCDFWPYHASVFCVLL